MLHVDVIFSLRGAGAFHAKHDFSDNIGHRDMEQYLTFEPIDVVREAFLGTVKQRVT